MACTGSPVLLRLEHADDWPWAGVSARARLGAVLGAEYDGTTGTHTAKHTTVLASAPIAGSTQRVAWTLVEHAGGAFVFSGSELGFSWQLDLPALPSERWIDAPSPEGSKHDYPVRSVVQRPVQRLVENLIAHATGLVGR